MIHRIPLVLLLALGTIPVSAAGAARLGLEAVPGVQLAGEQSEALCAWYKGGVRDLPLVQIAARPGIASPRLDFTLEREALRTALERESCEELRPRTGSQVRRDALYDADNFALPGFRLGVIRELWWVMPTRQAVPAGEFDRFKEWLRVAVGLPEEFIGSLRHEGRMIGGIYRGLPVRVVTLADLPAFSGPVLVAIDAEYFVWHYDNPIKESMLAILAGFFATLRDRQLATDGLVVSSSCTNARVTPVFGYLAPWVKEYLAAPERINLAGPPETWVKQSRVEYLDVMLARDQALEEAERLAALAPESAHPWYFRAQVSAGRGEGEEAKEFLGEAVRRDPCYKAGYVALAGAFEERQQQGEARALLEAGSARFPEDLALGLALINLYLRQGAPAEAVSLAGELSRHRSGYPVVAAAHALALRAAGRAAAAEEAMASFRGGAPEGGMRRSVLAAWEESAGWGASPGNEGPAAGAAPAPAPRQP